MAFGNQPGQVRFTDVTETSGVLRQGQSWGVSIFDLNQDGLPDIYQNNHQQKPVSLFLNQGDGLFTNATFDLFPRKLPGDFHGAVGFDVDNDGDLDLFQGGGGDLRASDDNPNKSNRFWIQEAGELIEVAEERGVRYPLGRARQPNVFDFNDDGRLDLLFTAPKRPDLQSFATIFMQQADGSFNNLGDSIGLDISTGNGTFGVFADVTGDYRHELIYVARDPKVQIYDTTEFPLREMSADILPPGLLSEVNAIKDIAVADFNGDAYQDLLIVQQGTGDSGFRLDFPNSGRAHFEYEGKVLGLTFKQAGKLFLNFEGDSSLKLPTFIRNEVVVDPKDIYIGANRINPKSLNFSLNPEKESQQGLPEFESREFGVFIGYDTQKKQWDLRVSARREKDFNVIFETERINPIIMPIGFQVNLNAKPDVLLTYDPELGQFVNSTASSGLDRINVASRNVIAEDFDNDGDRDIFLVATANTQNLPDVLYENLGDGSFRKVPRAAGAEGVREGIGNTVGAVDFDLNGFIDIYVNNGDVFGPDRNFWLDGTNSLFKNEGNDNRWIQIDLRGTESNRDAVGATVYVTTPDGKRQVRSQNSGIHNRVQNFPRLHFGIGQQEIISEIEVVWPDGDSQIFRDVAPNRVILLQENNPNISTVFGEDRAPQPIIGTTQGDRLVGTREDDVIKGLAGDDRLRGRTGNDTLVGGNGDDVLVGSLGEDVLRGGTGEDDYMWTSPMHGGDRIVGFESNSDEILISRVGFGIDLSRGTLPIKRFVLGSEATARRDRLIYDRDSGQLFFDPDGTGTQNSELLATFSGSPVIQSSDIEIF